MDHPIVCFVLLGLENEWVKQDLHSRAKGSPNSEFQILIELD